MAKKQIPHRRMKKCTVPKDDRVRLNVMIRSDTFTHLRMVAAHAGHTLASAADRLLEHSITRYDDGDFTPEPIPEATPDA